jgi:chromosomal replication initiator protein
MKDAMVGTNYEGFWDEALNQLRTDLGEEEFSGWFTDINYMRSGENSIAIGFPSAFYRDKFKKRYQNTLITKLKAIAGKDISLEFEIAPNNETRNARSAEKTTTTDSASQNSRKKSHETVEPAEKKPKEHHPQMRDDYTFEKYIIGENNNFAVNAANAISRNPGTAYNPFLIYGGVGLGKTHLMQAIGNYIHENSENTVICVTSEDFLNEYMDGIKQNTMNLFKNKYRYVDVLLIDDIQILQDKPGVQEELFHTFNALINAKKQLVFTCDRPPSELKKFSERLISRFEQSLKVDLQPPRYEIRCVILKAIAENRGTSIPVEVIDLISKNISSNIRDLKGALETLIAYTELMGQSVTLEIAQQKLRDVLTSTRQSNLSIETIQKVVADFYSLNSTDLKGKKRNQKVVYSRQLAMFISREMTDYSTTEIGESFGGKDHTTVMHSINKIQGLLITDPVLDSTIENLKRQIKEVSAKL